MVISSTSPLQKLPASWKSKIVAGELLKQGGGF